MPRRQPKIPAHFLLPNRLIGYLTGILLCEVVCGAQMKTKYMVLLNSILFVLLAALIASMYNYYKEKRLLKEFIRHSRRHRYHQDMDMVRRQKANRYLTLSIILFCMALPLLLENFIQAFIEDNWKWILPVISLSIFLRLYKNYIVNRNNRVAKSLLMSFENANNS